ncbi:MAG: hypothetical protein IT285_09895 [Bdellovibrionales bacterium]|nr:hypothetical protein [Bdellovibrionales bacterium]
MFPESDDLLSSPSLPKSRREPDAWGPLAKAGMITESVLPPLPAQPAAGAVGSVRNQMESILYTADRLERLLAEERYKNHRMASQIAQVARDYEVRSSELGNKRELLLRENADLKASLEAFRVRNEDLNAKLRSLEGEIQRLKPEAHRASGADKELKELRERGDRLTRELQKVSTGSDDLQRRLVEVQAENQGLSDQLQRETRKRLTAERTLVEIRDSATTLTRMHEEFRTVSAQLVREGQTLRERIDADTRAMKERVERVAEIAAEGAHESRHAVQFAEGAKYQVEKHLGDGRAHVERLTLTLAEIRPLVSQAQAEMAQLRERVHAFESTVREKTEGQLRSVKEGYEILARQADDDQRRARDLNDRLEAAEESLRTLKPLVARADGTREEILKAITDARKDAQERYDRLNSLITLKTQTFESRMGALFASKEPTQDTLKKLISDVAELREIVSRDVTNPSK